MLVETGGLRMKVLNTQMRAEQPAITKVSGKQSFSSRIFSHPCELQMHMLVVYLDQYCLSHSVSE